jgi:hypothetical protein
MPQRAGFFFSVRLACSVLALFFRSRLMGLRSDALKAQDQARCGSVCVELFR